MDDFDLDLLADGWIAHDMARRRYVAGEAHALEAHLWVVNDADELIDAWPEGGLDLVRLILDRCDRRDITKAVLASGPLERLLVVHGPSIIAQVEKEARRDPAFASLLAGVWKGRMSEEVWTRVRAVSDRSGWDGIPEKTWPH